MFDINAKLGPWPYRPVRGLDAYLRAMDAHAITHAAVSALDAVHFLNPQDGNLRLAHEIAPHRDRLTLFAVLRPNFTGASDDLDVCVDQHDAKGIVLHPNYHDFTLTDPTLEPLMAIAATCGLVVCVQAGLEDPRRQFRPYKTMDVPADAIGAFARAYPEALVVALGLKFGQPEQMGEPLPDNLYFDTSNYERLGEIEYAIDRFGAGRILLGSGYPLFNPRANIDKIRHADIPDDARHAIAEANARRLIQV